MGAVMKVIDAIVLGLLVVIALAVPLFDAQLILPPHLFPEFLINFKDWLTLQLDHYLLVEKPYFYVGFAWLQLLFNWPLSIAALYSFAAGKTTWFTTTCLPLAVSLFTCLVRTYIYIYFHFLIHRVCIYIGLVTFQKIS